MLWFEVCCVVARLKIGGDFAGFFLSKSTRVCWRVGGGTWVGGGGKVLREKFVVRIFFGGLVVAVGLVVG
ncbi:MAG: hypothetical protein LUE27_00035, partial [Clostridia bacterium]|nr:hypothetical protein [Clostridia bacterium]